MQLLQVCIGPGYALHGSAARVTVPMQKLINC
jgi:hypothetical protein